jgi:mitochondrial enoyl-[acyl-carrier protein] reductase / trans-2-enoyl-CoA reductase
MLSRISHLRRTITPLLSASLSHEVVYKSTGHPLDVYELAPQSSDYGSHTLSPNEVFVKFLAAPINPADINLAEGKYGISVPLPAVGGNEGVARVEKVGSQVKSLRPGHWVIPARNAFGTWRQFAIVSEEDDLIQVPNDIPIAYAASLSVNPCTAYRMLKDFVSLKEGDVVIQNGANSMVGLSVIQLCKSMNVKTINIVRSDRPDVDNTLRLLTNLGGDVNITDEQLRSYEFHHDILSEMGPIKMALNCVGGRVVTDMVRLLPPNTSLVSYGGMSRRPINLPMDLLTSRNISMKGFWVSKWYEQHSRLERAIMIAEIASLIRSKQFTLFYELHDIDDFQYALRRHLEPFQLRKVLLNLDYPDRLEEHDSLGEEAYKVFETNV